jgi:hypothetical protein
MSEPKLDWSSAEVKDSKLTVPVEGELPDGWEDTFHTTVQLLGGGSWGEIKLEEQKAEVSGLTPGSEEKLKHFLESVVLQANASSLGDEEEEQDDEDDEEQDEDEEEDSEKDSDADKEMSERFRSFAEDDESDEDESDDEDDSDDDKPKSKAKSKSRSKSDDKPKAKSGSKRKDHSDDDS